MGTLTNQPPRQYQRVKDQDVVELIHSARVIAQDAGIPLSDVLEAFRILELRRKNDLMVANQDVLDEQLAGFGDLLERTATAIEAVAGNS